METRVFPVAVTMTNWSIVDKVYREYFNVTPSTSFDFDNNDPMGLATLTGSTDHVNITIGIVTEQELFLELKQILDPETLVRFYQLERNFRKEMVQKSRLERKEKENSGTIPTKRRR